METLWDFLTLTKGHAYIVAFALMILFIPFFNFLTERDSKSNLPDKGH